MVGLQARAALFTALGNVLFLTQEVWETAGDIGGITYWIVLGLFPLVGILFLTSRLKAELEPSQTFAGVAQHRARVAMTVSWANHAEVIWSFELDNRQLVLTEELLRVAGIPHCFHRPRLHRFPPD